MKKLLATILMGAVTAASVFGLTACGDGDKNVEVPKGVEVTETEWKAAIQATSEATNFTCEFSESDSYSAKYKDKDGKVVTESGSIDASYTYSVAGNEAYSKQHIWSKRSEETTIEYKLDYEEYKTLKNSVMWEVYLSSTEFIQGAPEDGEEETPEWEVYSRSVEVDEDFASNVGLSELMEESYLISEDSTEAKELADLYSAFTYSDGKYTANLYNEYHSDIKVEISIKDSYVTYYAVSYDSAEENEDGYTDTEKGAYAYIFKNYGSTTLTAPAGALEAIEKYKADIAAKEELKAALTSIYDGEHSVEAVMTFTGGEQSGSVYHYQFDNANKFVHISIESDSEEDGNGEVYLWKETDGKCYAYFDAHEGGVVHREKSELNKDFYDEAVKIYARQYTSNEVISLIVENDIFSRAEYDKATKEYTCTFNHRPQFGDYTTYNCTLKFEDKKLVKLVVNGVVTGKQDSNFNVEYNYDNVSVTVPNDLINMSVTAEN